MTARVLVVDDNPANVRLMEARLLAEYFQVLTAENGRDALRLCQDGQCDIVLLDVMMPEMDGFEVCRRLKANPATLHLPVVMVTALDEPEDRVRGLEAGADDFLTKPVNDLALVTRVKSLARLKFLTDELRLRAFSGGELDLARILDPIGKELAEKGNILVVDDRPSSYERIIEFLAAEHRVTVSANPGEAIFRAADGEFDCVVISLSLKEHDPLRLCSQLRTLERTRFLPIIMVATPDQDKIVIRALELGVNDYLRRPIEKNEFLARVRTQVRRKRYNEKLRDSVQATIELAVMDPLTGMHNRRYFENHLSNVFENAQSRGQALSLVLCDIDNFKTVNDRFGHDAGDEVLREFAERLQKSIRNIDFACRFGGEEFVVVMPETDIARARAVAERIRLDIAAQPFLVRGGAVPLNITVSLGVSNLETEGDSPERMLKRADVALYNAKRSGRNQVVTEAA
jgi:two-component system, cell cycle response regulator